MNWLVKSMKWIMLVSGLLTATVFVNAIAPHASLVKSFGQDLEGPLAELLVRNWGILVGLVGLMLVYGAFVPPARRLVLSVAALSKAAFVLLVVTSPGEFLGQPIGTAVIIDSLEVLLFVGYLLSTRHPAPVMTAGAPR